MQQKVGTGEPATDVAAAHTRMHGLLAKNNGPQIPIHDVGIWYPQPTNLGGKCFGNFERHRTQASEGKVGIRAERHTTFGSSRRVSDQQRTTESASPASLVSLYLLFISLAV